MTPQGQFIHTVFGGKPDDVYILAWTLADKRSRWFRDLGEAVECAEALAGQDVYVGVGLAGKDHGPHHRCPTEEVAGILGFWADLDLRSPAHPKVTLPATVEEALTILPREFPPSIVVCTGNGAHVWWIFREPWIFESEKDRKDAATLACRLHSLLRDNASQLGWTYERLADLARVLRIPGTTNCKDPANPKPVVLHCLAEHRYNPSDFAEYLDELGISDDEAEAAAEREWADRFKDTPLTIDLNARFPEETLVKWQESDLRFKKTWFRQRHDLNDQSQSGYDLALCNFGFSAGLTEQQIVDLLIHHRVLHKQKHRTRVDYFRRTLAKAAQARADAPPTDTGKPPSADSDSCSTPLDSSRMKALLCRRISHAFEIEVLRIVKMSGKQPFYRMETAVGKISFGDVAKLISQKVVRTAIAGTAGRLIPSFKPNAWQGLAQAMLDACIVEEGGEELQEEGAARLYLGQYLSETAFIPSIEGRTPQEIRRPMVHDGQITVCASDLQLYINKTGQQAITVKAVVSMLSAIGAKTERVRGSKFKEQSRWFLPLSEFDPKDYIPEPEGAEQESGDQHG